MKDLTKEELRAAFDDPTKVVEAASGHGYYPCLSKDGFEELLTFHNRYVWQIRELLPYENLNEFLKAQKEHGPYLRFVNVSETVCLPLRVDKDGVYIKSVTNNMSYDELMKYCRWQDHSFCGKMGKVIK